MDVIGRRILQTICGGVFEYGVWKRTMNHELDYDIRRRKARWLDQVKQEQVEIGRLGSCRQGPVATSVTLAITNPNLRMRDVRIGERTFEVVPKDAGCQPVILKPEKSVHLKEPVTMD